MSSERLRDRFTRDPFGLREAEREGGVGLADYFFEHPLFSELLGQADSPESTVVFAGRGAGKTTLRQAIELYTRRGDRALAGVLSVPYIEFSRPLEVAAGGPVTLHHHVAAILRCAVGGLLDTLHEGRAAAVEALPRGEAALLGAFVRAYSTLFAPGDYGASLQKLLRRLALAADPTRPLRQDVSDLLTTSTPSALIASLPTTVRPAAAALRRLSDLPASALAPLAPVVGTPPAETALPAYRQFRDFLDLLPALGYQTLYVLVDRVDETSLLADPAAAVAFIRPLLSDLYLLEEPRLAFKIFLPGHLEALLSPYMRPLRLRVKHLIWSEADLLALLARRLQQFSRTRITSLSPFCDQALRAHPPLPESPSAPYIDAALVRAANGLPRLLLWRARLLFDLAAARDPYDFLTSADLEAALRAVPPLDHPLPLAAQGLHIDPGGQVWRDGVLLPQQPRAKEIELLRYLYERRCQVCPKQEILLAVWDEFATDTILNTTLSRLRKAVEPDPARPRYVLTVEGQGLRLVDPLCG